MTHNSTSGSDVAGGAGTPVGAGTQPEVPTGSTTVAETIEPQQLQTQVQENVRLVSPLMSTASIQVTFEEFFLICWPYRVFRISWYRCFCMIVFDINVLILEPCVLGRFYGL